jgi:hypothetical protein
LTETYGLDARSYSYIINLHAAALARKAFCIVVPGSAFFDIHRALLIVFENSYRAVSGSEHGVPFWDIGLDDARPPEERVHSAKYFGTWGLPETGYQLTDGAFADFPIRTLENAERGSLAGAADQDICFNGYGYQRSPWNFNDSPVLTRGNTWAGVVETDSEFGLFLQWNTTEEWEYFEGLTDSGIVLDKANAWKV